MIGDRRSSGAFQKGIFFAATVAALLLAGSLGRAASMVPSVMQLAIMLKALEYEKSITSSGGPLVIGFLAADEPLSKRIQGELLDSAKNLGEAKIQGRVVQAVGLGPATYAQTAGLKVLYVGPGLESHLPAIKALARAKKILTVTGVEGYLGQGIALGILPKKTDKPQIVIDLVELQAEGASLDGRLLRLAVILKN